MSVWKNLNEFLAKHSVKNTQNAITHTRIPDKSLGIYGGSYNIEDNEMSVFNELYYNHVFINKNKEYLTEKQLQSELSNFAIDIDFRYSSSVVERQHTQEHVIDIISLYLEKLKLCLNFTEGKEFDVFVFEKPSVNILREKEVTKDGIHIILGLKVCFEIQQYIRDEILKEVKDVIELPIINDWDSVLDEGITKGSTNWQLFGSRKPGNEAYELSQHFIIGFDTKDSEFIVSEKRVKDFNMMKEFMRLSVRNKNTPSFSMNEQFAATFKNKTTAPKRKSPRTSKLLLLEDSDNEEIGIQDIDSKEVLKKALSNLFKELKTNEYDLKEMHEYVLILPPDFYLPGSHLKSRQVAFALKDLDERMFLTWISLRAKSPEFDYGDIPSLYKEWKKIPKGHSNGTGNYVTCKSIMYWAKQYSLKEYLKVKEDTVDFFLDAAIDTDTDFDVAQVLFQLFKDRYVCVSYQGKGVWYEFKNHRWMIDKGITLRLRVSKTLYDIVNKKQETIMMELTHFDQADERAEFIKKKASAITKIMVKLKNTQTKNNIMREAMELFYDPLFIKNADSNKMLLGFNNGVIDFGEKKFRDGYPQDYITKSTNINYMVNENEDIVEEVHSMMNKLFPIEDLNRYMWDHLASCLIGTNSNQTFNIYHGSGSNGKSILTDMMACCLGDYKGTVPITIITEKRPGVGNTSSEVMALKGLRYAVMQEPSKEVKLNEGVMKELTGGDPVQGRQLYQESDTFDPQFTLTVCTNNLFDVNSNDDGTWRRIRKVDFISKFVDTEKELTGPYIYLKDKNLKEKLPSLAETFVSLMVKITFKTGGIVEDSKYVMESSQKYRLSQDHIACFVIENVLQTENKEDKLGKNEVYNEFKLWFQSEQGHRKPPKGQELYDYMERKFGGLKNKKFSGIKLIYSSKQTDEDST